MKIVSFKLPNGASPRAGALIGDGSQVLDFATATGLEAAGLDASSNDWFDLDGQAYATARGLATGLQLDSEAAAALRESGGLLPVGEVRLLSPVPRPGKVICIGLNYKDHAAESKMDLPDRPLAFSKFSSCVVGSGADVIVPPGSEQLDYEAELGVVIGKRACRVPASEALDYVLGYTNVNDVSARDFQFADGQWQRGKSCDTFCPTGPWIVTPDELGDPHVLRIRFRLNGKTLQDSNTDQLHHRIPELIAQLSAFVTLEPGDLIATGTPPGVGFARTPPVWVRPEDLMEVEIAGLGILENPVVQVD